MDGAKLRKDREFEQLVQPLSKKQYRSLEEQLLSQMYDEPIYIWHGSVLDGQERLELCYKHEIPVKMKELFFKSRENAIVWICLKQGQRLDLTKEMQKYLIGKRYIAEKTLAAQNMVRRNQYSEVSCEMLRGPQRVAPQHRTAVPLGEEYGICYATVQKYGAFAAAVDKIMRVEASMCPHLLYGQARVSHENVILISNLGGSQIKKITYFLENSPDVHLQIEDIERVVGYHIPQSKTIIEEATRPSVKDMPAYDPDIEISGLSLTIPSWKSSIERVQNRVDMKSITETTRKKLEAELLLLRDKLDLMLSEIREEEIHA